MFSLCCIYATCEFCDANYCSGISVGYMFICNRHNRDLTTFDFCLTDHIFRELLQQQVTLGLQKVRFWLLERALRAGCTSCQSPNQRQINRRNIRRTYTSKFNSPCTHYISDFKYVQCIFLSIVFVKTMGLIFLTIKFSRSIQYVTVKWSSEYQQLFLSDYYEQLAVVSLVWILLI